MRLISAVLILLVVFSSCEINGSRSVRGNGRMKTESRSIAEFSGISVSGPFEITISQEQTTALRIEAEENLFPYIEVKSENGQLTIGTKRGFNIRSRKSIRVFIAGPKFENIAVIGSGDINSKGKITGENIDLSITGSGDGVIEFDAPRVRAEITGSGSARLTGQTETLESEINGSGDLHAYELLSENTKVNISGSGNARVYASKQLTISIAGSGDVGYKGNPVVNKSIAGSGNIHKEN